MAFFATNRAQITFLPPTIDDYVPAVDKSRFVLTYVDRLDLSKLEARYSPQGGDSYPPKMMLAVWFYAYSQTETSCRKIEDLCRYDLRYIYVAGNLKPDHSTLSRFRKANIDLMPDYFSQIVKFFVQDGITNFKETSIDGSKLQAFSSKKQSKTADQLDRLLTRVRADIKEYMNQCEQHEQSAIASTGLEKIRQEKARLEALEQELLARKNELTTRQSELKTEHRPGHQMNLVEPDAAMMPKINAPGYNGQIAVDSQTQLIGANDVVSKRNDQHQFQPMQQQVDTNVGHDPQRQYDLDSGYHNLDDLKAISDQGLDVVMADPNPKCRANSEAPTNMDILLKSGRRVERCDFAYRANEDDYECPANK